MMCRGFKDMLSCLMLLQEEPGHRYSRYEIMSITNLSPGLVEQIMELLIGMDMVKLSASGDQKLYQYRLPFLSQYSWDQLSEVQL